MTMNKIFIKYKDIHTIRRSVSGPAIILMALLFLFVSCRHATVAFDPPEPNSCRQGFLRRQACEIEKAELQDRILKKTGQTHKFVTNYFFWGAYPRSADINAANLCKEYGIREIHQYTTALQGVYSELSLGIFLPRTTVIQCY